MKKLEAIKSVAALVVSIGVGAIVSNIVKGTTPSNAKTLLRVCVAIGSFVLTGLVSEAATKYTEKTIDETVDMLRDVVKEEPATQE